MWWYNWRNRNVFQSVALQLIFLVNFVCNFHIETRTSWGNCNQMQYIRCQSIINCFFFCCTPNNHIRLHGVKNLSKQGTNNISISLHFKFIVDKNHDKITFFRSSLATSAVGWAFYAHFIYLIVMRFMFYYQIEYSIWLKWI